MDNKDLLQFFYSLHYLSYNNGGYSLEYERDNVLSRVLTDTQNFNPDETCEVYHLSNALNAIDSFLRIYLILKIRKNCYLRISSKIVLLFSM